MVVVRGRCRSTLCCFTATGIGSDAGPPTERLGAGPAGRGAENSAFSRFVVRGTPSMVQVCGCMLWGGKAAMHACGQPGEYSRVL